MAKRDPIAAGLLALASQLGQQAARMAVETNDLEHYVATRRSVGDLLFGYWDHTFKRTFLSAFYSLAADVRARRELRNALEDAIDAFMSAAKKYTKRGSKLPPKLTGPLTWFDGTKQRRIVVKSQAAIERLARAR